MSSLAKFIILMNMLLVSCNATSVKIINDLARRSQLTVHCKSGNDDLGSHVLSFRQKYSFDFIPHPFGGSLYFCGVTFNGKSHRFDAYRDDGKNYIYCNVDCVWKIREKGPCLQPHWGGFYYAAERCIGWD